MRRAEARRARSLDEIPRTLGEADFLLGVNDEARQGALRFADESGGPFLAPDETRAIPPLVELPKLLSAAEHFLDEDETAEDLRILLAPGSSVGGARPKASVLETDGQLAIAKFSSRDDEHNVVAWEAVALTLAEKAGVLVPSWRMINVSEKPVLLIRRFDRIGNIRVPFLSAMSMLQAKDNDTHSYLEIADALRQYGADPSKDLAQLWRRIVFGILISNTDDHLRNHGFLYERHKGWRLSSAYDLNPTPVEIKPRILTTTIDLNDGTASLDLALSVLKDFRLSQDEAKAIMKEVGIEVAKWRDVAQTLGLNKAEIDRMVSAFEHSDSSVASK